MYVKTCGGLTRTLAVTEHFRIEDIKEEVYCYPRYPLILRCATP
jgi:hypothetical protein